MHGMDGLDTVLPKPEWLRVKASFRPELSMVRQVLRGHGLRTVCDSSHCPNLGDCWSTKSATFLILGPKCSRDCKFCAVDHSGADGTWDEGEADRLAAGISELGLEHVVITSVTRDDLPDGGAEAYARSVRAIKDACDCTVELLIPDMGGSRESLAKVAGSRPDVLGHNLEVVERLQPIARDPRASFRRSLDVHRTIKELVPGMVTKSSLMLGLGERDEEVRSALQALRSAGVDIVTLGQYLRPGPQQLPVVHYVPPSEFDRWREAGYDLGFGSVQAGPFVRSSYKAREAFEQLRRRTDVDG